MSGLRLTAVMKTDIRGFTSRVGMMSATDLGVMLDHHKRFITAQVEQGGGTIIKGEGDSFWIVFSSVTTAALTAIAIQDELLFQQAGKGTEERLAVRIVITAGDVLFQDNDIFGETVNLTARIEGVTPADEIYLAKAAWLALDKSHLTTSLVGEFSFKGFPVSMPVYKINRRLKTRSFRDQFLFFSDLTGFSTLSAQQSPERVEEVLDRLDLLHVTACQQHGGIVRLIIGDSYFLTFTNGAAAARAALQIGRGWDEWRVGRADLNAGRLVLGIHQGDFSHYRSSLFGREINVTARVQELARREGTEQRSALLVTQPVREALDEQTEEFPLRPFSVPLEWREKIIYPVFAVG